MTSPQEFYTSFQASRAAIQSRLDTLTTSQRPANLDQIAQIAQQIQVERKKLNEATTYLPSYDRRSYETQLQDVESRIDSLRSKNVPAKGAFSFRKKTPTISDLPKSSTSASSNTPNDVAVPAPTSVSVSPQPLSASSTPTSATPSTLNLYSSSHKILTLTSLSPTLSSTATSTNLTIISLSHCIVDLLSQPPLINLSSGSDDNDNESLNLTAVHIRDVSNSILLLGHIRGSILAHNLDHCIIVASCHQLRIHASQKTTFHIHVTSNGIIEDSTSLTFASYPSSLPLPPEVRHQESKHTSIQDFSHPRLSTPSPNWRSIPSPSSTSSSSATDWTWDDIRTLTRATTTTTTSGTNRPYFQESGKDKDKEEELKTQIDYLLARVLPQD